MRIENKNGLRFVYAEDGMFLTNGTLNAQAIVLGDTDAPENYTEKPMSEFPHPDSEPLTPEEQELLERLQRRANATDNAN